MSVVQSSISKLLGKARELFTPQNIAKATPVGIATSLARKALTTPIGPRQISIAQAAQQTAPNVAAGFGRALSGQGVLPKAYSSSVGQYIGNFGQNLVGGIPSIIDPNKSAKQKAVDVGTSVATAYSAGQGLPGIAQNLAGIGLGTGLNYLGSKATGQPFDFQKSLADTQRMAYQSAGVVGATNPLLAQVMGKAKVASPLIQRGIAAGLNVGQGLGIDVATGQQTTPASVGIDVAMGLLGGPGQFGKSRSRLGQTPTGSKSRLRVKPTEEIPQIAKTQLDEAKLKVNELRQQALSHNTPKTRQNALNKAADELDGWIKQQTTTNIFGQTIPVPPKGQAGFIAGPNAKLWDEANNKFSSMVDKKPRFEVDDSGAKLKPIENLKSKWYGDTQTFEGKLPDILDHKLLFKNYPDLKDADIVINTHPSLSNAHYQYINGKHIIQVTGQNKQRLMDSYTRQINDYSNIVNNPQEAVAISRELNVPVEQVIKEYRSMLDEMVTRRNSLSVLPNDAKSTLLHEIQHAIQQKEGFAKGGNLEKFAPLSELKNDNNTIKNKLSDIDIKLQKANDMGYSENTEIDGLTLKELKQQKINLEKELEDITSQLNNYLDPYQKYQRLAGELEARAVQRRMDIPTNQRSLTDPYAAEAQSTVGSTNPNKFITRFGTDSKPEAQKLSIENAPIGKPIDQLAELETQAKQKIAQPEEVVLPPQSKKSKVVSSKPIVAQRKFIQTVSEAGTTTKQTKVRVKQLGQEYVTESNYGQIKEADRIIKSSPDKARELVFSQEPTSVNKTVLGIRLAKQYENAKNYDAAIDVVEELDRQLREQGRGIQAASLWNKLSPEAIIRSANRVASKYGTMLDDATKKVVYKRMSEIQKLPEGVDKNKQTLEVLNMIADRIPLTRSELFDAYRYTNLLSSPKTHERNIYQNLFTTLVARPLDMVMGATYDLVRHPYNPMARDISLSDAPKYYKSVFANWNNALGAAKEAMKTQDITLDMRGDNAIEALRQQKVPGVLSAVPKFMQAQDKFFSTLIASGEKARLMSHGLGEEQAQEQAVKLAEKYLLREKLGKSDQGAIVRAIDAIGTFLGKGRHLPVVGKPYSWFVPFVTTPVNAAKFMVEHSALNLVGKQNIDSETVGKAMAGSLFTALGATYALQDKVTWEAPNDEKAKELFYASGKKPFSVQMGDSWIPMWYLGPYALAFAIPAAVKYHNQDTKESLSDDGLEKVAKVASAVTKFIASQTPLQGLGGLLQMLDGDVSYTASNILGGMATQAIPASSFLRYVSSIVDPIYRKGYDFESAIKKTIPGMSMSLEPYTDPEGVPSKRLAVNYVLPYDVGQRNAYYEPLERARLDKVQQNSLINKAKKEAQQGAGSVIGATYVYKNQDGEVKTLDLSKYQALPEDSAYNIALKQKKAFEVLDKVMEMPTDKQDEALSKLGISKEDAQYYQVASQTNDLKSLYAKEELTKLLTSGADRQQIYNWLVDNRREVNGKQVLAPGVIDELVDANIISYADGAALKKLEVTGTGQKRAVKAKSGKAKKIKLPKPKKISFKVSIPKVKKIAAKKFKVKKMKNVSIKLKQRKIA